MNKITKFNYIIESIKLINNSEFMASYKKAKEQIKNRKFADWNAL